MAASLVIPKTTSHARSNSLPSKSHPLSASIEDTLYRLKSSESRSSSASATCNNLSSLKELHDRINELIQMPSIHRALSHGKLIANEVLDGSLRLLDVCSTARDVLLYTKESIQELESSLRRKRGGETGLIGAYMISRKKASKMASKCIRNLKNPEKRCSLAPSDEDSDLSAFTNLLSEAEIISTSVLKSVLSYVSASKQSRWSVVCKIIQQMRGTQEETNGHEVRKMDAALQALTIKESSKEINSVSVQNVLKQLHTLESSIQELKEGLEAIFRCIVKTRVSLLNVLN